MLIKLCSPRTFIFTHVVPVELGTLRQLHPVDRPFVCEVVLRFDVFGHPQYVHHVCTLGIRFVKETPVTTVLVLPVLLVTLLQVSTVVLVLVFTVFGQLFGWDFSH